MKQDYPTPEDFIFAAWLLKCEPEAIQAVAEVEAGPYGAFLQDEEGEPPVILYERHYFHRLTAGRHGGMRADLGIEFQKKNQDILSLAKPGGYGPVSIQHDKLKAAAVLNRDAALKSCSWGLFQIMGANHVAAGYPDIQRFVNAMYRSVQDHLRAFTMFIRHDSRLVDSIRSRDWLGFARVYNGPRQNGYDKKMEGAYKRLTAI